MSKFKIRKNLFHIFIRRFIIFMLNSILELLLTDLNQQFFTEFKGYFEIKIFETLSFKFCFEKT